MLLYLLRHGKPAPDERANEFWELAPDAGEGLAALRTSGALPSSAVWYSSPEPKALATARALTDAPVEVVEDLREMVRPAGPWLGAEQWRAFVHASMAELDTPARPGWEPGRATMVRVTAAARRLREANAGKDLVLAGHGTAWTLLVSALTGQLVDFEAWNGLLMPDLCVLDVSVEPATVVRGWGGWVSGPRG
ncbi:histidine phosphatase family protein [Flindersiella endophytica]